MARDSTSKSPPCRIKRDKDGAPSSADTTRIAVTSFPTSGNSWHGTARQNPRPVAQNTTRTGHPLRPIQHGLLPDERKFLAWDSTSKSPPCRTKRDKDGAPSRDGIRIVAAPFPTSGNSWDGTVCQDPRPVAQNATRTGHPVRRDGTRIAFRPLNFWREFQLVRLTGNSLGLGKRRSHDKEAGHSRLAGDSILGLPHEKDRGRS